MNGDLPMTANMGSFRIWLLFPPAPTKHSRCKDGEGSCIFNSYPRGKLSDTTFTNPAGQAAYISTSFPDAF